MSLQEDVQKIEEKVKKVEEQSWAMSVLSDYKRQNKRLFIIWIITFLAFIGMMCYTIYLLNDIGTIEETTTQEITDVENIGGNAINKGDVYGEN